MADIELVIKISEEQYDTIKSDLYDTFPAEMKKWGLEAIVNGTPLLKEQQPCEDCISREKAKQFLYERLDRLNDNELYDIFSRIIDDMYNELPSVTPARPVGKWQIDDLGTPKCPFCNYMGFGNYCNECGADLREVSEDE